jgi:hypothetical protein
LSLTAAAPLRAATPACKAFGRNGACHEACAAMPVGSQRVPAGQRRPVLPRGRLRQAESVGERVLVGTPGEMTSRPCGLASRLPSARRWQPDGMRWTIA